MHAAFSCFADLALVSPQDYRKEGQGSLLQCVLTPADSFMPMPNEQIADLTHQQVGALRQPPYKKCKTSAGGVRLACAAFARARPGLCLNVQSAHVIHVLNCICRVASRGVL